MLKRLIATLATAVLAGAALVAVAAAPASADPAVTINPAGVASARVGVSYTQSFTATGGVGPYTFELTAGSLPAGLTVSSAGVLSGTPTEAGSFGFILTATDSASAAGSASYTLGVGAPILDLNPTALPAAAVGVAYSQSVTPSGGTAPYTFRLAAGSLPAGLTLAADGTISGTPTAEASASFTVIATDSTTGTGAPFAVGRSYSLTVVAAAAPTVTSVSPASGPAAGGTSVTITGTGFTGVTAVSFGATTTTFTVVSATQITAVSPAGTGTADVTVTNGAGTSPTSTADRFTYLAPPTTTGIWPTSGDLDGGSTVTLTGTGFTGATAVSFGSTPATSFTVDSDTQITATVPASAAAVVNVQVTGPGGTSPVDVRSRYGYNADGLQVTSPAGVIPLEVGAPGLTIPLATTRGVLQLVLYSLRSRSNANLNISGAGDVVLNTTGSGAGWVASDLGFSGSADILPFTFRTVGLTAAPTVTALSPVTGSSAGGDVVHLTGTGFGYASAVRFGSVDAVSFTIDSDTSITAVAPAGLHGAVDVTVTNVVGTSATSSADEFTAVTPPPVFTTAALPDGQAGVAYSAQLPTPTSGVAPYAFAVTSGSLPSGLALNAATGAITGTPSAATDATFVVTVTDSASDGPGSASATFELVVAAAPVVTPPDTTSSTPTPTPSPSSTPSPAHSQPGHPVKPKDRTKPTITITGVKADAVYLGALPVVHCTAVDNKGGSGIKRTAKAGPGGCTVVRRTTATSAGTTVTFTATAVDKAGNKATRTLAVHLVKQALSGATAKGGVFLVKKGHRYALEVVSRTRPQYVHAAPAPQRPSGLGGSFTRDGSVNGVPRWRLMVTIDVSTARYRDWNLGVLEGTTLKVVRIRL